MNFVYYLENGKELTHGKSKRNKFFNSFRQNLRWQFLMPYSEVLDKYEKLYRTPEVHGCSVLKKEFFSKIYIDPNKLLVLVNRATNIFWENTLLIVGGGEVQIFPDLHFNSDCTTDPKYSE